MLKNNKIDHINHEIRYNEKYDSFWCVECNVWTEKECGAKSCEYCGQRPKNPMEKTNEP